MAHSCLDSDPVDQETLIDLLRWRSNNQSQNVAYTFRRDMDERTEEVRLTYQELDRQAQIIGSQLQSLGGAEDRILLLYPPGLEYIAAFFGCLYAGKIAVPAYPPRRNRPDDRLQGIIADAGATIALTNSRILSDSQLRITHTPELQCLNWLATDTLVEDVDEWRNLAGNSQSLAFLQYSSGSTASPKGVIVNHANVLHNLANIQQCFELTPDSRAVIWLPPYHDMGLIGGILQPLYTGFPVILMSPFSFLQRPFRWLQAISHYKATISGGPNFAYELCLERISPEERDTLDLSSWEIAFNGAEPIRHETIERFGETFGPCGFRREAFYPCYGLAEATLIVSGGLNTAPPVIRTFKGAELEQNRVVEITPDSHGSRTLVGCGRSLLDQQLIIVNPESFRQCPPDKIGEIWVSGPSVAQGYWNRADETEHTFGAYVTDTGEGPFLRTGDLGFIDNGELFITGRLKDLIIIRGRNHYPQDIELTVENSHAALRSGNGAVFSVNISGEEQLVVAHELVRHHQNPDIDEIAGNIRRAVAAFHEVHIHIVLLLRIGSIPKTSSGKIQRHACRQGFLDGTLNVIASSVEDMSSSKWSEDASVNELLNRETILGTREKFRRQILEAYLENQVARVLKIDSSRLNHQTPLCNQGLDSLMVIELKHNIEAKLGVILSVAEILTDLTISQLATKVLDQLTSLSSTSEAELPPAREAAAYYPLSYGQRALWFINKLAPESSAYNIATAVRIRANLDIPALHSVFQKLVNRHTSLRTTFDALHGEPIQRIYERAEAAFEVTDAADWDGPFLNDILIKEAHLPFDLEVGPLFRAKLFTLSEHEHVLLLVVHHIVADLWSMTILIEELGLLYAAVTGGVQVSLNQLNLQYTDYVRWQADMLAGPEGERHWAYWQRKLTGELSVLNLQTNRSRPSTQSYSGAQHVFKLSRELTLRIRRLANDRGVTLYTTLLAAFQVLLYRYTGQGDILVGSPAAGRNRAQWADLVGYFVNPIVLRSNLFGNPTFDELLVQVFQTVLDGLEHQDYPFALLVESLSLERDPSRSPLFQVMFILQKPHKLADQGLTAFVLGESGAPMKIAGLSLESISLEHRASQFDLTLLMVEVGEELAGSVQYNTDIFDENTIIRIARHFQTLLESIVTDPRRGIANLPLLSKAEEHQLLIEWNNTRADYPEALCIHQLFEDQVERTPKAIAVVYQEKQLSYQELNRRSNQVAHYLRELGVGPETRVGLLVEPSLEMMVGLLGILKAGGAYVPLDISNPQKRLSYIIDNAQVAVLLTEGRLKERIPACEAQMVCLDSDWKIISKESKQNPNINVMADNLSHVIYTSGSTGRPKGVMVQHESVVNLWAATYQSIYAQFKGKKLRSGLIAPLSFDGSIREYLLLLDGHTIHVLPKEFRVAGDALLDYMKKHAIDEFYCTPSQLKLLISAGLLDESNSAPELVLLGGEPIERTLWQLLTQFPAITFYNIYGPTECTVDSTLCCLRTSSTEPSIGRPIANIQTHILDDELQPVPIGVPGQLFIGGLGLARGYIGRPDLTAESFIPNPFSDTSGARLYKTGDLARYRSDGGIEFLGRIDYQVKVRGFTIELGEIEAVLTKHSNVLQSVVVVREDVSGDKRLVAYLVAKQSPPPSTTELRSFIKEYLPDHMVPSAFVVVGDFPLTNNGKIDRQMLPKPSRTRPDLDSFLEAPSTPLEQNLANIWIHILGIEQVGVNDNFFELGGTSLSILRVQALVWDQLKIKIPIVKLFQYPTIRLLADFLDSAQAQHAHRLERSRLIATRRKRRLNKKRDNLEQNLEQRNDDD